MVKITVLEPTAEPRPVLRDLSPRPDALAGKKIAFLNNSKPNVAALFDAVERRLHERYELAGTVHRIKPSAPIPTEPTVLDELARDCDVGIVAIAD